MAGLTSVERTSHEVASLRAQAEETLQVVASGYMWTRCAAVADTCAWVQGERLLSPATESDLRPDMHAMRRERMRAEDLEVERRRAGDAAGATRAGVVGQTLNWVLLDPDTEPPL